MYKLRASGNFNIILKDIGVYFSYPSTAIITEEQHNKSKELRGLVAAGLVIVENNSVAKAVSAIGTEAKSNVVFVTEGNSSFGTVAPSVAEEETMKTIVQEVKHVELEDDAKIVEQVVEYVTESVVEEVLIETKREESSSDKIVEKEIQHDVQEEVFEEQNVSFENKESNKTVPDEKKEKSFAKKRSFKK